MTLAALAALALMGCGGADDEPQTTHPASPDGTARLRVGASIFPLYEFVVRVGGDRVEATMIIPPGVEPHSYEPSPGDIRALNGMDLIVYNGAGMEPWLEQIVKRARPKSAVILEASAGLALIPAEEHDLESKPGEEPADDHDHAHDLYNPHTWLDPQNAARQMRAIERALAELAPAHAAEFKTRADQFEAELLALDRRLERALSSCRKRDVVITHASLTYFCRRYGLNEIPISGLTHQNEPSPRAMAGIVTLMKERGAKAVFCEIEISPRLAETVARETGAAVLPFNTLPTGRPEDLAAGRGYVAVMEENLAQLCRGLECDCE